MTTKHTVTRAFHADGSPYIDNMFSYRGVLFERDDSNKGYWGHYKTFCFGKIKVIASTRARLLYEIDQILDAKV